jgi:2-polyprenyl-6-methoxyphenol hydroxylase-like FAD-dependent oxidoreductase
MRPTEILVVGAGPTGLALALQAYEHGASVRIIERRQEAMRPSRALIVHPRTLEALRPLGLVEPLLARADRAPEGYLHVGSRVIHACLGDLALTDTAFPHLTFMRQMDVEMVLAQALQNRGIQVEWGTELIEVSDGGTSASVTLQSQAGLERLAFDFVVGCDGPESIVRRVAGIGWPGRSYRQEVVLADLELDTPLAGQAAHVVAGRRGLVFVFALGERASWRLLATQPSGQDQFPFGQPGPPVTTTQLQALLDNAGLDARITDLVWSARYRMQHRIASRLSQGRLYLAGDAAHAFSPATGQGMNTGIQDALNLGWKLAFAAPATDAPSLLASYDLERRPVAHQVFAMTHLAFYAEASTSVLPSLLRSVVAPLGAPIAPVLLKNRRFVAEAIRWISQLRVAYPNSPLSVEEQPHLRGGPHVGDRLPDMTVISNGQRVRLHALLAQPGIHVLLQHDASDLDTTSLGAHVTVQRLTNLPGAGLLAVRPDGYVGFRCGVADMGQLVAWLTRIGALVSPSQ